MSMADCAPDAAIMTDSCRAPPDVVVIPALPVCLIVTGTPVLRTARSVLLPVYSA